MLLFFKDPPPPCIITHGHVNVEYVYYGLNYYNGDANHIQESFAKLLQDLEYTTNIFFSCFIRGSGTTPLYEVVLYGKEVFLTSLEECSQQLVPGKVLPPTLYEQFGNCAHNNKYWYVLHFWSLLAQSCTSS